MKSIEYSDSLFRLIISLWKPQFFLKEFSMIDGFQIKFSPYQTAVKWLKQWMVPTKFLQSPKSIKKIGILTII